MTTELDKALSVSAISDADAMVAGRAILDAHGQWELENNRYGAQNPWQREHIMLLGRSAILASKSDLSRKLETATALLRRWSETRSEVLGAGTLEDETSAFLDILTDKEPG